jgi:hypothetical protein
MNNLSRYSLNTLPEAEEYAALKRSEGYNNVKVKPLYYKGKQVGYSVFFQKD